MAAIKQKPIDVRLTQRKSRALDDRELIWLFKALDRYTTGPCRKDAREQRAKSARAIELLLRSMCRRGEIFPAQHGWVGPDVLRIPATKGTAGNRVGFPLSLPLTPSMLNLIGTRPETASDNELIFGANHYWLAHAFECVRSIMTTIAREEGSNADFLTAKFDGEHNPVYFTLHDFRDTGKRILSRALRSEDSMPMFPNEVREAMLNHREKGIAAIYNSDLEAEDYLLPQRRSAGLYYNDYLDKLKAALALEKIGA